MSGESILTVSAAVVLLVQLVKWSGLPPKLSPVAVLVTSLIGVAFWAWTQDNFVRQTAFDYFAGFVSVAAAAAGVFGFVREGSEAVTSMRKGTGNGLPPSTVIVAAVLAASMTACASTPIKQRATLGLQAAHTAVAGAQDIERGLYAARMAGITPEKHGQFATFFGAYFDAEERVALALRAWRSGDPAPESLAAAMAVLREAVDTAVTLSEGAERESLVGKLGEGIRHVQAVLDAITGGGTQ